MRLKDLFKSGGEEKQSLVKREESNPIVSLQHDMNRLFDDFFHGFDRGWGFGLAPFRHSTDMFEYGLNPKLNVSESDKEIQVSVELPGMDEKDVEVELSDDFLTIKGEKKVEKEDKGKEFYRFERSYGKFCRTVPMGSDIDREKVDAAFKKGVLTVTLPKTEQSRSNVKKLEVKKGD